MILNNSKLLIFMKKLFLISLIIIAFVSCNKDTKLTKVSAIGKINSVLVVIDNDKWQNEIGDSVRDVLAKPLVGFPQEEVTFSLSQVSAPNFNRMLKHSRNIVSIKFGNKNSFSILKNKYAAPQRIVVITTKNKADLVKLLSKHEKEIINTFKESDIRTSQNLQLKKSWDKDKDNIKTFKNTGVSLKIPYDYIKERDTLNYVKFIKDISEGYLYLQIYTVPLESEDDFTPENIIKYRNEKGKQFIHGEKDGDYLTTEAAYTPIHYDIIMLGRKTIETRSTWAMVHDDMAGPFLNYALLDKKNNRIVVAEGFVYAPNISKRDYLFEIEALLKTIKIE